LYTSVIAQNCGWCQQQPQNLLTKTIGRQVGTISFDSSELSAGTYSLRLTGEGKLAIKQIVKQLHQLATITTKPYIKNIGLCCWII